MLIALEMSTPCLNAPMMAGVKSVTALTRTTSGSDVLRKVSEFLGRMSVPIICILYLEVRASTSDSKS